MPLKNRLLVPLYIRVGTSIGYNDNVFKFSESEKSNSSSFDYMGMNSTYDSSIIKPEVKISYSPKLFSKGISNFIVFLSSSNYPNIVDKNNFYSSIRFEYKIGPYNWFKVGYKNSTNNFLRYYVDDDIPGEEYLKCNYDSESAFVSYSANFNDYGWGRITLSKGNQLFNPHFTEFDLDISSISFKHYFRIKSFNVNFLISKVEADNTSFTNGLNSTAFDRSYNSSAFSLKISKKIDRYIDKISIGCGLDNRFYLSEKIFDPLHLGRSHLEHFFSLSLLKELRNDTQIELKYKVRHRQTKSEFDWVESLKTFYDNQFMVKIMYDMDIDWFY